MYHAVIKNYDNNKCLLTLHKKLEFSGPDVYYWDAEKLGHEDKKKYWDVTTGVGGPVIVSGLDWGAEGALKYCHILKEESVPIRVLVLFHDKLIPYVWEKPKNVDTMIIVDTKYASMKSFYSELTAEIRKLI